MVRSRQTGSHKIPCWKVHDIHGTHGRSATMQGVKLDAGPHAELKSTISNESRRGYDHSQSETSVRETREDYTIERSWPSLQMHSMKTMQRRSTQCRLVRKKSSQGATYVHLTRISQEQSSRFPLWGSCDNSVIIIYAELTICGCSRDASYRLFGLPYFEIGWRLVVSKTSKSHRLYARPQAIASAAWSRVSGQDARSRDLLELAWVASNINE